MKPNLTFSIENVKDVVDDLMTLWDLHWKETEMYRNGQGFNMDVENYIKYNEVGFYILYTARDNGKMVGNCGMYVCKSMHTQKLIATDDTIFMMKEYRKGFNGVRFLRFVQQDLINRGVVEITMTIKSDRVRKLYETDGYKLVAYQYSKPIEENYVRTEAAQSARL